MSDEDSRDLLISVYRVPVYYEGSRRIPSASEEGILNSDEEAENAAGSEDDARNESSNGDIKLERVLEALTLPVPVWGGKFGFDDHVRCLAARQYLESGKKERKKTKVDRLHALMSL